MRAIDFFDRGVSLWPDRLCVKDQSVSRSFREVQERSCQIANVLMAGGVGPGDKVGVYSGNCAAALEAMLGILRAGAVWVPVNARNAIAENTYIFGNCDVEVLFIQSDFAGHIPELRAACPQIGRVICLDAEVAGAETFEALIAQAPAEDPDVPEQRDAMATLFSSGGTTGRPKGAAWSNLTWETIISNFLSALPPRKPPVHLMVTPLSHAAGVVGFSLLAAGATQIILPGFDATKVMQAIEQEKVSYVFLPPTAIYSLLSYQHVRDYDVSSLEYFLYAAAPMSVERLKECIDVFGPVMAQTFGQAEAPMFCTVLTPREHLVVGDPARERILASCGRPALLNRVAVMDDAGRILPSGERGEIVVRGNLVMLGYYNNPEATAEASQFGWHHTGDIGEFDEEGYLYIVDRKRDMIISGGFNIYPSEVEQVIWAHPAVQDCAVIGVPDDKWGEAVKAVVEPRPGAQIDSDELILFCKARLGSVKAPKSVDVWQQLPRSPVGKVRKKDIRAEFWKGAARAI